MKTKLLKKVRKEYEIFLITKNNNPNHWLYGKNCPYFILKSQTSGMEWVFNTKQEALSYLINRIDEKYFHLHASTEKNYVETKVWHAQKTT